MTVLITLTTAGLDVGPFDLSSDINGYSPAFETGITRDALIAGYLSNLVPDNTNIIRLQSSGICINYEDVTVDKILPTYMGLAQEYETDAEACAGITTIQTVTYFNNLQVGTVLSNFAGVTGNTGFFKITSNSTEGQYVGQILGVNDDNEVQNILDICSTTTTSSTTAQLYPTLSIATACITGSPNGTVRISGGTSGDTVEIKILYSGMVGTDGATTSVSAYATINGGGPSFVCFPINTGNRNFSLDGTVIITLTGSSMDVPTSIFYRNGTSFSLFNKYVQVVKYNNVAVSAPQLGTVCSGNDSGPGC